MSDCVDLGKQVIILEDCEGCADCADCRSGCCPIWLKICIVNHHGLADMPGAPTGGWPGWDWDAVEEVVTLGQMGGIIGPDYLHYVADFPRIGEVSNSFIRVTTWCDPDGSPVALGCPYMQQYIGGVEIPSGRRDCIGVGSYCDTKGCDPIWWLSAGQHADWPVNNAGGPPVLVHNAPNKLHIPDVLFPGDPHNNPPCCLGYDTYKDCSTRPPCARLQVGSYTLTGMVRATGIPLGCSISSRARAGNVAAGKTLSMIPAGISPWPGCDPTIAYCYGPQTPDPRGDFFGDVRFTVNCAGTITVQLNFTHFPYCYSSPGAATFFHRQWNANFTSAPGQTLPYSGVITGITQRTTYKLNPFAPQIFVFKTLGDLPFTLDYLP